MSTLHSTDHVTQPGNDIEPIIIPYDNNITIKWTGITDALPKAKRHIRHRSQNIIMDTSPMEEKKVENEQKHYESWSERAARAVRNKVVVLGDSRLVQSTISAAQSTISNAITLMQKEALGYAAAGTAFAAFTIGVGMLAEHGYTKYKQWDADDTFAKKENYNSKVELFNSKIDAVAALTKKISEKKTELMKHEAKLKNTEFVVERSFVNAKVLVAIGPTGYGKSLFCNRMIGNQKDIETISESDYEEYAVAEEGDTEAQTIEIQKSIRQVKIIEEKITNFDDDLKCEGGAVGIDHENSKLIKLSVVDTQGAFDTNNNDKHFQNQIAEYFRACGGVNMFCIFFKFKNKIDANYQRLLKEYETFWGKYFWKHCVIVITNCDLDSDAVMAEKCRKKLNKKLTKFTKPQIKQFLFEVSDGECVDVPIFCFGEENYNCSTRCILQKLADEESVFWKKYKCENIVCPMDALWEELEIIFEEYKKVLTDINDLGQEIEGLKKDKKVQEK